MNDHRQIGFLLKEAGIHIQFLNEDVGSIESIREDMAPQIEQLLEEATKKLRESANLLNLGVRGGRKK
jgi:hypothetical protein